MKIVMVCDFFDEALEYQENLLAKYYAKAGHQVLILASTVGSISDFITSGAGDREGAETVFEHGRLIRLPYAVDIFARIRAFPGLRKIFEREKPDLIFFHDITPNLLDGAAHVRRSPACRLILDYHADISNSGKNALSRLVLHRLIRRPMLALAMRRLSAVFPIVPASADFLATYYGVRRDRMKLLPLGVDLEVSRQVRAGTARAEIRRELGIGAGDLVVFTGGKFHPYKQTEKLVEAIQRLDRPDVKLMVIGGPGADAPDYGEALLATMDHPSIRYCGWCDRQAVYRHMAAADVAVFPASQSVLWQQSLGMGLPLVVSEISPLIRGRQDVSYMNGHGAIDVLDPRQDMTSQLAAVVEGFADDRARLARRSAAALRTAEETLDYEKLAGLTLGDAQARYSLEANRQLS